jgi:hypothetical protein
MQKIISEVMNSLNKKININNNQNIPKDNFIQINKIDSNKKIAFIDGGSAELLKSNNFSLQIIRIVVIITQNNKKIKSIKNEFFLLAHSKLEQDKIVYESEIFQIKGDKIIDEKDLRLDSFDETIKDGINRAEVSKIGDICRRFAELRLASKISDSLNYEDIVILDGNLKINYKNESKYIKNLKNKKTLFCSLSKTFRAFNNKGGSFSGNLNQLTNELDYPWYFKIEDNKYAVKLNKNSKYLFEFEILNNINPTNILSSLISNCNDAVFPGYPYGLILADKFARISNQEKEYLINLFKAKAGKNWTNIEKYLNSLNAHSILDKISF